MDNGQGRFKMFENESTIKELLEEFPNHGGIFKVGEHVQLKGSTFRIKSIKPTELRLKLLKRG